MDAEKVPSVLLCLGIMSIWKHHNLIPFDPCQSYCIYELQAFPFCLQLWYRKDKLWLQGNTSYQSQEVMYDGSKRPTKTAFMNKRTTRF